MFTVKNSYYYNYYYNYYYCYYYYYYYYYYYEGFSFKSCNSWYYVAIFTYFSLHISLPRNYVLYEILFASIKIS